MGNQSSSRGGGGEGRRGGPADNDFFSGPMLVAGDSSPFGGRSRDQSYFYPPGTNDQVMGKTLLAPSKLASKFNIYGLSDDTSRRAGDS